MLRYISAFPGGVAAHANWYLRFKLNLRGLVEMMAERGLSMAHTIIMRWVQRYAPEFEKRWRRPALGRRPRHAGISPE
jgi:transposase-like protein